MRNKNEQKRAALYCRVSTPHQSPDMQIDELRRFASYRGFQITMEFIEVGQSGARRKRPQLGKLMDAARTRQIDVVLVWRFDRFARSLKHLVDALTEFDALGVDFISMHEKLDTTTPVGRLMFQLCAAFGEFERELIRERVTAGVRKAQRDGKRVGRPRCGVDPHELKRLFYTGKTYQQIGEILGVSKDTVGRRIKTLIDSGVIHWQFKRS